MLVSAGPRSESDRPTLLCGSAGALVSWPRDRAKLDSAAAAAGNEQVQSAPRCAGPSREGSVLGFVDLPTNRLGSEGSANLTDS